MDKKTMLKIFGEAFLRSMVVLMAVAIVGFGAFFLIKVNTDSKQQAEVPSTEQAPTYSSSELEAMLEEENANDTEATTTEEVTTEEVTTEEPTTEAPDIPSTDKNILVLNGTRISGLAGSWQSKLIGAGFPNIAIGNSNLVREDQTRIYVAEEGMGNDLVQYFSDAVIIVGSLTAGDYQITRGSMAQVDIFIVIGNNDTTVQ